MNDEGPFAEAAQADRKTAWFMAGLIASIVVGVVAFLAMAS